MNEIPSIFTPNDKQLIFRHYILLFLRVHSQLLESALSAS